MARSRAPRTAREIPAYAGMTARGAPARWGRGARFALIGLALAAAGTLAAPPAAMAQQSSDANLASIAFTDNDGGTLATTLSPAFAAATTSYTLSVSAGAPDGEVTFAPTANDAGASFAISPADANASKNGHQVDVGTSNATVTVTAADSTTKAYAFDVRYDYDDDNDGYIDVRTRAQLHAIRDDLNSNGDQGNISAFPHALSGSGGARFGCPSSGCVGYELRADIDLSTGGAWSPIGGNRIWHTFNGKFRGNGHVISNMTIGSGSPSGLFQRMGGNGVVEGVGLLDVNITSGVGSEAGAVSGTSGGLIRNVYATGSIDIGSNNIAGGLVGWHTGTIRASWADVAVTGSSRTGGMVGYDDYGGRVYASYSIGPVAQTTSQGLIGEDQGAVENVDTSYHDAETTGIGTAGTGRARSTSDLQSPTAYGSTGIYSAWDDQDIDGDGTNDDAWDFGTSSQYPVLKAGGHSAAAQFALQSADLSGITLTVGAAQLTLSPAFAAGTTRYTAAGSGTQVTVAPTTSHASATVAYKDASDGPLTDADGSTPDDFDIALSGTTTFKVVVTAANGVQTKTYEFTVSPPVDYDDDNDGYIDIRNAAQLSAMRHDLDTDGNATHADWLAAFPSPAAGMGCAPGDHDGNSGTPDRPFCRGYELRSAIVLDVVGSNQTNWTPIGTSSAPFTGYFTGNGLTISNLSVRVANDAGLFGVTRGTVERVGLIDMFVRTSSGDRGGALAGTNAGTIRFAFSTGSVSLAGQDAGGLVGCNCAHGSGGSRVVGSIYASWSTASAVAGAHSAGGLVGENAGTITASYAAGLAQGYRSGSPWHGGLVGHNLSGATVTASYALGAAALIGNQAGTATASLHGSAVSLSILAYTGVYQTWDDHDTDGNGTADAPWNFGDAQEYPYLRYGFTQAEQTRQRNALNRKLSGLTIRYAGGGPVALSPAFSALTTSYTATIRSGGTRTLTVTPSVPAGSASVSLNGDKLSGADAQIAATQSGTTASLTVNVVNQLSSVTGLTYTITVSHADGAPIAPRNLTATPSARDNGRMDLSWSADSTVNGYEICRRAGTSVCASSDAWTAISGSGASTASHAVTGLTGGAQYTFSLRATDSSNRKGEISSVTATTNDNIVPSFAQTTGSVTWTRNRPIAPYTVNAATGGDGTLSYSAAFSPSPSGLSFNAATQVISGTPTHAASIETVTATVTVRDDEGTPSDLTDDDTATFTLTITLEADSTPSFASTSGSAAFTIGKANIAVRVHQLPALTGGNGALSYTDTLPTGLVYTSRGSMDTHGGTVNATDGNTLTAGTATYEIRATDRDGSAATYRLTATVETDQTPSYAGGNALADRTFIKDTAISSSVAPAGGNAPVECAIASGTLPSNVTLTGCLLTGTPNVVLAQPSSATIRATDRDGSTALSASFTMRVVDSTPEFSPDTARAKFTKGRANSAAYPVPAATGGDGTLTYSLTAGTLPADLTYTAPGSMDTHGGTISGTPRATLATGDTNVTITATDANGSTDTLTLTVEIENDVSPAAASGSTTYAIGQAKASGREFTVPALGGNEPVTYAYAAGGTTATQLPSGMSFDPADRKIKGTPPSGLADGSSRTITIRGTDRDGQAADYTLTLSFETNVTPSFSPNTGSRTFTIGRANTAANAFQLPAVSGNGTIRYAVSSTTPLPSGLVYTAPGPSDSHGGTVNAASGNTLSASDAGNYAITATDDEGESSTFTLTVAIETDAQTAFAQSSGSASYTIGRANTAANEFQVPAASAGNAPVTYAYVAGASAATQLPAALSFAPADRKIKGTPGSSLTAGSRTITIRATDRDGQTADFTLTLTLQADLTPSFSPSSTGSAAYVIGQANAAARQFTVPAATGGNAPYAYAYVAGATTGTQLPSGLSFDPADRKIKGTVASSGLTAGESRTVTIRAADRDGSTADFTLTLTLQANSTPSYAGVNAPPNRTFSQNKAIQAFSVAPAGGNAPACSITSGTLPSGLVISGCQISGTPDAIASAASITITATDLDGETATASFTITIVANQVPSFSPNTASAAFTIGRANTTPYPVPAATGGDGTLTYAVDSATPLPSGLVHSPPGSMDTHGGTINATAGNTLTTANSGTYNIIATDSNGDTATLALAVTIETNLAPSWASTSGSAAFTIGRANASAFPLPRATGGNGTLSYAVDSTTPLPSGLVYSPPGQSDTHGGTVNATSGNTLTASDAGNYTIRVTDRDGSAAAYTLTVTVETNVAPSYANANALPDRTFSQNKPAAAFSVAPSGGNAPVTCAISSGTLPNGLVISGCQISGTPDTIASAASITITATDRDGQTASDAFTITIVANQTPSFSPNTASATWTRNRPIAAHTVNAATGGDGTLSYSASFSPSASGLAFDATMRRISGTPTHAASTVTATITVRDDEGSPGDTSDDDTATFTLTITLEADAAGPSFGTASVTEKTYVAGYASHPSITLPAADSTVAWNGDLAYSVSTNLAGGTLPAGLTYAAATSGNGGTISIGSGTTATARFRVTLTAADRDGSSAAIFFYVTVEADATPSWGAVAAPNQTVVELQTMTSAILPGLPSATAGNAPVTYSIASLPSWLAFDGPTRVLSATAPAPVNNTNADAVTNLVLKATDANAEAADLAFTVAVQNDARPPSFSPNTGSAAYTIGRANSDYALFQVPAVTGGNAPVTYAVQGTALPSGLSLRSSDRRVVGTPGSSLAAASADYVIRATDADNDTTDFTLTLALEANRVGSCGYTGRLTVDILRNADIEFILPVAEFGNQPLPPDGSASDARLSGSFIPLPAGLSLLHRRDPTTGYTTALGIVGNTATAGGGSNGLIDWTDRDDNASVDCDLTFTLTGVDTQPAFGSASQPTLTLIRNETYAAGDITALAAATSGQGPLHYTASALPAGLSLNFHTRQLSGAPTALTPSSGARVTLRARDTDGDADTLQFTVNVVGGVTLSATSLAINEANAPVTETYTVALASQPSGNVVVRPSVTACSGCGVTVSPSSLTFTRTNWSVPKTVTVRVAADADGDDETATITHTVTGGNYAGVAAPSVAVSVTDDDSPRIVVPTSLSVAEGASASYSVRLSIPPASGETVTVTPTFPSGLTRTDSTALTFTSANYSTTKTVTFTADSDGDVADASLTISHAAASGVSGSQYAGLTANVVVAVDDDDYVGVVSDPTSLTILEQSAGKSYAVRLGSQPSANVTLTPSGTGLSFNPSSLSFTMSNWDTTQNVTVTVDNDANTVTESRTVTHTAASTDTNYNASFTNGDVTVTAADNDSPSVVVNPTSLTIAEQSSKTYALSLATQPSANVVITVSVTNNSDVTVNSSTFTFTTVNYGTTQNVTVSVADDPDAQNESATISHSASSTDTGYHGIAINGVSVTVTDNDEDGINLRNAADDADITALAVTEGQTAQYRVELTARPTAGVTITPSATGLSFNPSSVSFSTSNWSGAKLITVTPANDLDGRDESVTVAHAGSASGGYNALTLDDLTVTVTDDDPTGPLVANASGAAIMAITVAEGAASNNTYRLSLNTEPSSNVTVALTKASGDSADVTFAPSSVVFTPGAPQAGDPSGAAQWNSPQTITISAAQDDDARNDDTATITHTTSVASGGDSDYANQTADLAVTITDDDSPGLVVSATSIGVIEGSTQTYSLKLASEPSADVAVTPQCTAAAPSCAGLTFSGGASGVFTFTTGNWNTTQEVTVSATDNNAADGARSATITHAVSSLDSMNDPADAQYNGVAFASANVRAAITDDDAPGVTVNPTSVSVEEENATGASYSVRLATQPSANVVIAVSTNNSDVTFTPSTLTFAPSGAGIWSSAQSVTVKANNDPDAQDETGALSHRASSSDSNYNGITISGVSVAVTDNDEDGVDVSDPSGANPSISVNEQGSATYQVKLTAQPTGNVIVTPSVSAGAPLRVSPSSATFTRTNWNSAKTFTVRADDDRNSVNETATISHGASGAGYGGSETRESLAVTIMDNDQPGLRFTAPNGRTLTTLALHEGRAGSYRVALNTQPSGNVTVTPSATGVVVSGGGGTGNNEFAFTPTNYSSPQTVTVTPASDGDDDDEPQANLAHAFASTVATDPYHQLAGVTLAFTVADDDFVGLRAAPSSLNVTEEATSGDGRTYALSLGSQPSANVTVTPSGARLSFNPSSVTFTNGNWDTPQNVTVSVAADANAVNETLTVSHSTGASGDAEYANKSGADSGFTDARVRVVALDDDRPTVTEIVFWGMPSARAVADTYVRGAAITVQARFSRPVTVTGTPRIALRIGGATRYASYARTRTGGTSLDFRYQVQENDIDATNGVGVPRDALQLNGGSIRHAVSASVGADLRSAAVPDDPTRKVDGRLTPAPSATTPRIESTPPTAVGEYGYGETIEFLVSFDIPFRLDDSDGKPRLRLTLGAQTRYAEYDRTEGNGLFFDYVVRSSDSAPSGAALPQNALELNGARIVNAYDDSADANLTLPRLNADSGHKVDGTTSSLQSLAVSPGTLSPAFAAPPADASAYRVEVGNSVASATITAAPKFGAATLAYSTTDADPASGHQVGLEVGENRFDVTVTGRTTIARRYAVTFRREGASNADLRALSVSDPTLRLYAPRAMRHGYDPRETEYTLDVGRDVASVTLVVVKSDSGASASVSLRGESLAVDAMGEVTVPLEHGDNPVSISVTSRNPTTKTYAVNVMRAGLPVRLASLTLGGGALVKSGGDGRIGFDPSHFEYTASVINRVSSITVTPSAESGSRITVNGAAVRSGDRSRAIRLVVGSNSIVVSVTNDEPGAITGTYRIAVTRGRAPAPVFSPAPAAPIPTTTPTPDPAASPTPDPAATPPPAPTATPMPAPTATPAPAPTATATPVMPPPAPGATSEPPVAPTPTAGYSLAFWLAVGGAAVVIVAGFAGGALVIARRR